jgi:hypothetical protein
MEPKRQNMSDVVLDKRDNSEHLTAASDDSIANFRDTSIKQRVFHIVTAHERICQHVQFSNVDLKSRAQ